MSRPPPNDILRDLSSVLGDPSARELVGMFLDDFPNSIRALAEGPENDRQRIAHGLKSSAATMGLAALSNRMAALEKRLGAPPPHPGFQDELAAAVADFEAHAAALRAYAASEP